MPRLEEHGVVTEFARLAVSIRGSALRLGVHVKPKASRSAVLGVREGSLEVSLTSPPADGAANEELVRLLAKQLDVRRGDVTITTGHSSRKKVIEVTSLEEAQLRERLARAKR